MPQELAGARVGDDGSLVADDWVFEPCLLEVREHRAVHAPGGDDDTDSGRARAGDRLQGARPQEAVFPDQRPVEVAREDLDVRRKLGRKEAQLRAVVT